MVEGIVEDIFGTSSEDKLLAVMAAIISTGPGASSRDGSGACGMFKEEFAVYMAKQILKEIKR